MTKGERIPKGRFLRYDRGRGRLRERVVESKIKGPPPPGPRSVTGLYVPWRLGTPGKGESVRWVCVDERWVALALGHGDETGKTVVTSSEGRREVADDYESALALAKSWRV